MSFLRNLASAFVPVRERRESSGTMAIAGAEVVHDVNGDEAAMIYVDGGAGTLNATFEFTGSADGVNFFPVLAFPYAPGCVAGTIPVAALPLLTEAVNTTGVRRAYCVAAGQLRKLRLRYSAYTAGSAVVTINSEAQGSLHPTVMAQKSGTLMITATGAAAAAVTATLPAVAGLRHYIDFVRVVRSSSVALTAGAAPTVVTTTNIPGTPALTFGADASPQGADKIDELDFGSSGMAAIAINTATTVVCPATTGVIWRVNVAYRLGL